MFSGRSIHCVKCVDDIWTIRFFEISSSAFDMFVR